MNPHTYKFLDASESGRVNYCLNDPSRLLPLEISALVRLNDKLTAIEELAQKLEESGGANYVVDRIKDILNK